MAPDTIHRQLIAQASGLIFSKAKNTMTPASTPIIAPTPSIVALNGPSTRGSVSLGGKIAVTCQAEYPGILARTRVRTLLPGGGRNDHAPDPPYDLSFPFVRAALGGAGLIGG